MKLFQILHRFLILGIVAGLSTAAQAQSDLEEGSFESSVAILDTNVLFAIGAREADQQLRGSFGWPTFQEGFVDGVYFRFDPDGYARFSSSARLDEDVFEVRCAPGTTACLATKGNMEVGLDERGRVQLRLAGLTPEDAFVLSDRRTELPLPPSVIEPLDARLETLLGSGGELIIKRELEEVGRVSLVGFSPVTTYLRWVANGQSPQVFPRGWPVPSYSENFAASGLTQPQGWQSGPQAAETTFDRASAQVQTQPSLVTRDATAPAVAPLDLSALSAGDPSDPTQALLALLMQQIATLQGAEAPSAGVDASVQAVDQPLEDGEVFVEQARARNLPLSAGTGVDLGNLDQARDVALAPVRLDTGALPTAPQPSFSGSVPEALNVSQLGQALAAMQDELIEIRAMQHQIMTLLRQGASGDAEALSALAPAGSVAAQELPSAAPMRKDSAPKIEALEASLLGQISTELEERSAALDAIASDEEADRITLDRQFVEDLLARLDRQEADVGAEAAPAPDTETAAAPAPDQEDGFVSLSDYINNVLKQEGLEGTQ